MKEITPQKISIVISLLFLCIFTFYLFSANTVVHKNYQSEIQNTGFIPESINGTTEFRFKQPGDDRIWHVITKYHDTNTGSDPGYNLSTYTFSKDSVYVINDFTGVPDINQWDISCGL